MDLRGLVHNFRKMYVDINYRDYQCIHERILPVSLELRAWVIPLFSGYSTNHFLAYFISLESQTIRLQGRVTRHT